MPPFLFSLFSLSVCLYAPWIWVSKCADMFFDFHFLMVATVGALVIFANITSNQQFFIRMTEYYQWRILPVMFSKNLRFDFFFSFQTGILCWCCTSIWCENFWKMNTFWVLVCWPKNRTEYYQWPNITSNQKKFFEINKKPNITSDRILRVHSLYGCFWRMFTHSFSFHLCHNLRVFPLLLLRLRVPTLHHLKLALALTLRTLKIQIWRRLWAMLRLFCFRIF